MRTSHPLLGSIVLVGTFAWASVVWADLTPKSNGPTSIGINTAPCDSSDPGLGTNVNLGSWSATNAHDNANSRGNMRATFTVSDALKNGPLFDCISLHYLQVITADTCPAQVAGKTLKFPQMDPPPKGWDYMYTDGAARTTPDPAFAGDTTDTLAWYHTTAEEANPAIFNPGVSYKFTDLPGDCPAAGVTAFSLYLVAEVTGDCAADSTNPFCLQKGSWLVLDAMDWSNSSTDVTLSAIRQATDGDLLTITSALANSSPPNTPDGFTGLGPMYTLASEYTICCAPEPASLAMLAIGAVGLLTRRRAA